MVALLATVGYSCETIDEDERFIGPIEGITPEDSTSITKKNVLIEDFTGQRCINCPNATQVITSLQETYGHEHIIAVALHGGQMSIPASTPIGLATPESQEYNTKWGVDSWPKGMVNRVGGLSDFASWSAKVISELQKKADVTLSTEGSSFDKENGKLKVNVSITSKSNNKATLQVWLTESKIIKIQLMPDGSANKNYEHNHVFRTSVNGTWGEAINMTKDETLTKQYEYTFDRKNDWKPENMAIVTFVSNETEGVMQVTETHLIKK